VGAATTEGSLSSLARRGMLVNFGNASGPAPPVDPRRLMALGSAFFTRPTMGDYLTTTEELDESAAALFGLIATGKVKIEIGQRFPLEEAARAHAVMESRMTVGASLLIP
jgi:NADPH:quinone reductase